VKKVLLHAQGKILKLLIFVEVTKDVYEKDHGEKCIKFSTKI